MKLKYCRGLRVWRLSGKGAFEPIVSSDDTAFTLLATATDKANSIVEVYEVEEVSVLGNYMNIEKGQAGKVVDTNGIAPAVTENHGQVTGVVVKQVGWLEHGTGRHQSNTVYDETGICPALTTIEGGGTQQVKVLVRDDGKEQMSEEAGRD